MGIDLSGARSTFEELVMADACTITRDADGRRDAVLNDVTGVLTGDAPPTTVYAGKCSGRMLRSGESVVAGTPKQSQEYRVNLPFSAPEVKIGDKVNFTTSRDPQLVGLPLIVSDVALGTNQVARKLTCTRRTDAVDRR